MIGNWILSNVSWSALANGKVGQCCTAVRATFFLVVPAGVMLANYDIEISKQLQIQTYITLPAGSNSCWFVEVMKRVELRVVFELDDGEAAMLIKQRASAAQVSSILLFYFYFGKKCV